MIRRARFEDFDRIMQMMENFANASPFRSHHNPEYNERAVQHYLTHLMSEGLVLVGERAGQLEGMLLAQINVDPWLPNVKTLREIAWWVEPEHRLSTLGYKLLKKYVDYGKKMTDADQIKGFVLTTMEISPDFDLASRGWRKIESNYVYEGV